MKKTFSVKHLPINIDSVLLLARVAIAVLMLTHGLPKLSMLFSGEPVQFLSVFGLSPAVSLGLAVFAEVFCSILILIGFGTRLAVIPLIVTMIVAVFQVHATDGFVKQELGIHYLLVYLMLLVAGSGRYSVDALIDKNLHRQPLHG